MGHEGLGRGGKGWVEKGCLHVGLWTWEDIGERVKQRLQMSWFASGIFCRVRLSFELRLSVVRPEYFNKDCITFPLNICAYQHWCLKY